MQVLHRKIMAIEEILVKKTPIKYWKENGNTLKFPSLYSSLLPSHFLWNSFLCHWLVALLKNTRQQISDLLCTTFFILSTIFFQNFQSFFSIFLNFHYLIHQAHNIHKSFFPRTINWNAKNSSLQCLGRKCRIFFKVEI